MLFAALLLIPRGFHRTYLFTGGLVHSNNSFLQVYTWQDIERVETQPKRRKSGQIMPGNENYYFVTRRPRRFRGSKKILKVRAVSFKNGEDPFYQPVLEAARRENISVVQSSRLLP
ncbi:hypothetical protein [Streptomyces sp. ME19-01-6]|uniref:hypothetical protein n=1 Tax=Streptomyces sp. ME19-01-6 TaxID=3028686 RepID=UPI0029B17BF0|nr:hypothetical protein [Streptomyces sp. ME19-01-6]MDX3230854.1 hypothetical protein [Streptomyces sp. ME19-01-6]